jgi:TRAP-type mannitol/chloroaromatic compound transport system permease large subunit
VFVKTTAAFLSPPVAISAFSLSVAPKHVAQPDFQRHDAVHGRDHRVHDHHAFIGMTLWLPNYLYGGG